MNLFTFKGETTFTAGCELNKQASNAAADSNKWKCNHRYHLLQIQIWM
jgi:hypothetical protein